VPSRSKPALNIRRQSACSDRAAAGRYCSAAICSIRPSQLQLGRRQRRSVPCRS
jgi:hypothetical protein